MIELTRRPDWLARMNTFIEGVRHTPMELGRFDCGPAFTGSAVKAMTGVNYLADLAGRYATEDEALAIIIAEATDLAGLVANRLPRLDHPSQGRAGDVAAIPVGGPFRFALGIIGGERVFVLRPDGIGTVDFLTAAQAFKVG